MKNIILKKAIRRYLAENHEDLGIWSDFDSEEMMNSAREEAMQDIESSGDNFVDLGKSEFEKDLSIEDMLNDLENAKYGKTGKDLQKIQKQINHLKRFGGGSLNEKSDNENNNDLTTSFLGDFEKKVPINPLETQEERKSRIDTELERLKNNQKKSNGGLEEGAESSRYMFFSNLEQMKKQAEELLALDENEVNEILENGHDWAQDHIATAKESMDQVYDFFINKKGESSEDEIEEGIGTGLSLNVKHGSGGISNEQKTNNEGAGIGLSFPIKKGAGHTK